MNAELAGGRGIERRVCAVIDAPLAEIDQVNTTIGPRRKPIAEVATDSCRLNVNQLDLVGREVRDVDPN